MKQPPFLGSCVALVTPFTKDGVNYEKLEELIEWHIKEGSNAILIGGTTGEASAMTKEEHKSVIRFTVEKAAKRIHVMAGTGSNNTSSTIELSQYAQSVGADSLLLVTPYYNKTTQEGLYRHFKAAAEAVTIPIVLYNVPARTSLNINPDTLKRLSAIKNIVALKECNLNQVAQTRLLCGDDLFIYSGEDGNVLPLLALGGLGVISVMANIVPADTRRMVAAFFNGDLTTSRALQIRAIQLIDALFCEVNPIPVKAAMNQMGFHVGECRLPLVEISSKSRNTLCAALKEYGLI